MVIGSSEFYAQLFILTKELIILQTSQGHGFAMGSSDRSLSYGQPERMDRVFEPFCIQYPAFGDGLLAIAKSYGAAKLQDRY